MDPDDPVAAYMSEIGSVKPLAGTRRLDVAVEKVSAWTNLVGAGEVLLSFFSCFALGGESLWCYRWA